MFLAGLLCQMTSCSVTCAMRCRAMSIWLLWQQACASHQQPDVQLIKATLHIWESRSLAQWRNVECALRADDYLTTQVGGAENLAELRRLKAQLDPTNFFTRCVYRLTGMGQERIDVLCLWLTTVMPSAQASLCWTLAGLDGGAVSGAMDDATHVPWCCTERDVSR